MRKLRLKKVLAFWLAVAMCIQMQGMTVFADETVPIQKTVAEGENADETAQNPGEDSGSPQAEEPAKEETETPAENPDEEASEGSKTGQSGTVSGEEAESTAKDTVSEEKSPGRDTASEDSVSGDTIVNEEDAAGEEEDEELWHTTDYTEWESSYDADDNLLTLYKYIGQSSNIVIPGTMDYTDEEGVDHAGAQVAIGIRKTKYEENWFTFYYRADLFYPQRDILTGIRFGEGVKTDGNLEELFMEMQNLETADLSGLVTTRADKTVSMSGAFKTCTALKEAKLPDGCTITSLWGLFWGCKNLENVDLEGTSFVSPENWKLLVLDITGTNFLGSSFFVSSFFSFS